MIPNRNAPQSRVPGAVIKQKEYSLGKDLTKLSKRDLLDLIQRQLKLLENKSRLQKLPDKGKKIQELYDRAVKALELQSEVDEASNLLSSLNIGKNDINNLEWRDHSKTNGKQNALDSDDDEDPLAILTSSNSATQNKRIVKVATNGETESLITEQDIEEAREIANGGLHLDPVLEHVIKHENLEFSKRFLPYKEYTNSLNASHPDKPKKLRDNSSATPPFSIQGVKMLPLGESIQCEYSHRQKMKELQEKQAVERLASKAKELGERFKSSPVAKSPNANASFMNKYRVTSIIEDDDDGNDEPLSDEEDFDED